MHTDHYDRGNDYPHPGTQFSTPLEGYYVPSSIDGDKTLYSPNIDKRLFDDQLSIYSFFH